MWWTVGFCLIFYACLVGGRDIIIGKSIIVLMVKKRVYSLKYMDYFHNGAILATYIYSMLLMLDSFARISNA